jgi:hypothetical protein
VFTHNFYFGDGIHCDVTDYVDLDFRIDFRDHIFHFWDSYCFTDFQFHFFVNIRHFYHDNFDLELGLDGRNDQQRDVNKANYSDVYFIHDCVHHVDFNDPAHFEFVIYGYDYVENHHDIATKHFECLLDADINRGHHQHAGS